MFSGLSHLFSEKFSFDVKRRTEVSTSYAGSLPTTREEKEREPGYEVAEACAVKVTSQGKNLPTGVVFVTFFCKF